MFNKERCVVSEAWGSICPLRAGPGHPRVRSRLGSGGVPLLAFSPPLPSPRLPASRRGCQVHGAMLAGRLLPAAAAAARLPAARRVAAARLLCSGGLQATGEAERGVRAAAGEAPMLVRKEVKPLEFLRETVLYESAMDVHALAATARRRCQVGAALTLGGFALFASAAPLPAIAALLSMAGANGYALLVLSQRHVRKLAQRHVESLVMLPTPPPESPPKAAIS